MDLYYAYGMVKQTARKKRSIIIGGVIIGVLLIAGLAYFLYSKKMSDSGEKGANEETVSYLKEGQMEFSQRDYLNLSAEFKKLADGGEKDKAFRLLSSRYESEGNVDLKVRKITQESSILAENGFADEALEAAFRADKLKSDTATLMQIAAAYAAKKDIDKQIEYIKKAMESLDVNPNLDSELKAGVKTGYQGLIDDIESRRGQ
ncbi:hypothetical protein D3C86_1265450 [compost metagenome]